MLAAFSRLTGGRPGSLIADSVMAAERGISGRVE
jgi:hypothetical protein